MSSVSEDDVIDNAADLEDDLFGDDDSESSNKGRELSDRELDSGDDEDRNDRVRDRKDDDEANAVSGREARILEGTLWRQPWPTPADGEFDELRLPKFLGIEPLPYDPETFELPTTDHHSDGKSANFSANATATSKMRYRKNPSTGKLESNTVVYKWSDGSTTISVGDQHFELQTKPLVPPKGNKTYQEVQDSHSYIASPSITSQLLVMIGHLTNQHTVRPNKDIEDDALEKLQRSLAAAAKGHHKDDKNGIEMITSTQDPELQKKRAEMAEKERMKLQRRRETAAAKADDRIRIRAPGGGLSVDDLEGRGGRRAPGSGRKPPGAKRPRRRPDYDSDDDMPRGKHREDEYDKNDDFLASSDEELEDGPGLEDDDEEEMLDDESERDEPKRKKQKPSKRDDLSDADADGDADLDDEQGQAAEVTVGRGRKRHIIEDDDDE